MAVIRIIGAWLAMVSFCSTIHSQSYELIDIERLPEVLVDGKQVKIHSQGLYVTQQNYIVTGRVDTPPRRPVVIQFRRDDLSQYEVLDLTLPGKLALNHPGGFDRDSDGVFWIPVSTSNPAGPTMLLGLELVDGRLPDDVAEITKKIPLTDHIGAIACLPQNRLLAANWDTKIVYLIDSSTGQILSRYEHERFFGGADGMRLAVQDWKYDRKSQQLIAGGIDKSSNRNANDPAAVIVRLDMAATRIVSTLRLKRIDDVSRPLTNEGMAIDGDHTYLLPEDLGRGAKLLIMRIDSASP